MDFKANKPIGENREGERWESFPGVVGRCPDMSIKIDHSEVQLNEVA